MTTKAILYYVRYWDGADIIDTQDVIYVAGTPADESTLAMTRMLADEYFADGGYDPTKLAVTIDGPFEISDCPPSGHAKLTS